MLRRKHRQRIELKERTEKAARARKNFLPPIILTIIFWGMIGFIIYFVDPETIGVVPILFLLTFFALMFTFSIIMANRRRGILSALVLTTFLILRYFGVGHLLNLIFLIGIAITVEIYFFNRA